MGTRSIPTALARLPARVAWIPGTVFLASAVLEPLKPNYLCGPDPWAALNAASWPLTVYLAGALLWPDPGTSATPRGRRAFHRRMGAMLGMFFVAGAAAILVFVRIFGPGMNLAAADHPCGCFGPVELPLGVHVAILGAMFPCLASVFLREEGRLPGRPGPL